MLRLDLSMQNLLVLNLLVLIMDLLNLWRVYLLMGMQDLLRVDLLMLHFLSLDLLIMWMDL